MGATIHYRPTGKEGPRLSVMAPSSFIEAITRAFGTFPVELNEGSIPVLRGMAAADKGMADDYGDVIETIERVGSIHLYVTY